MDSRRVVQALALTVGGAVLIAGCSAAPSSTEPSGSMSGDAPGGAITIGYAGSLTGPNNGFDGPILTGVKQAITDINAKGGVSGRQLQLVTADSASDIAQSTTAALQVIEQGAQAVIPSCDYNYGGPGARAAQEKGVLVVGCAGSDLFGYAGIGELTFNVDPLTTQIEGASMANYAYGKGWRKAFLFKDLSIDYSKQVCDYFGETFKKLGGSVVDEVTFNNGDASIQSQISKLKSTSEPDVVIMCSYLPGIGSAVKQIRAQAVTTPIVSDGGADGQAWVSAVPNLSDFYNNSVGSLSGDDSFDDLTGIGQRVTEATGEPPVTDYGTIFGYSEVQLIAAAIEAAGGSTTGSDLAKAIESMGTVHLAVGDATFAAQCHIAKVEGIGIREVQDGKSKFLDRFPVDNAPPSKC